jgi:hypothetical protein
MPLNLKLVALTLLQWIIVAVFAFNLPILRPNVFRKLLGIGILLIAGLGVPALQLLIATPTKDRNELNFLLGLLALEEIISILFILLGAYRESRAAR